jgi:hypothetical protein
VSVNFGIRSLLFLGAGFVFALAVFVEDDWDNLIAWGLAGLALSFLLGDLGWDRRYGGRR